MGSSEDVRPTATLADYYTVAEAAAALKISGFTVRYHIKHGILRARRFKGNRRMLFIRKDEVQALMDIRDQGVGVCEIRDLLVGLKVRLHSMESQHQFLMEVLGLEVSALRDQPVEVLLKTYREVVVEAQEDPKFMQVDEIKRWAIILCQFTELEFQRLVGPTQDIHPWKPFYNLCINLLTNLRRRRSFYRNVNQQQIYRLLDKARKQLSNAASVFENSLASNFGPIASERIHKLHARADSLDRYIEAEVGVPEAKN